MTIDALGGCSGFAMSDQILLFLAFSSLPIAVVLYLTVGIIPPWWYARTHGVPVTAYDVLQMRLATVNAMLVVQALDLAAQHKQLLSCEEVSHAYQQGADLRAINAEMRQCLANGQPCDFWVLVERQLGKAEIIDDEK